MAQRKDPQNSETFGDAVLHRAAILAASGMNQRTIARELGLSESQVSRWAKTPAYMATKNAVMLEAVHTASAKLRALAVAAVDVLETAMVDSKASPADRIRAASAILDRVVGNIGIDTIGSTNEKEIEARQNSELAKAHLDAQLDDLLRNMM